MSTADHAPEGKRAQNKRDKHERIFAAALALFDERGYAATTTGDIAERAGIAAGTLFRYAATKAELLLMVYNGEIRAGLETGTERMATAGHGERITALVEPFVRWSLERAANTAAYQREILYGDPAERYRGEGLDLFDKLRELIADAMGGNEPGAPDASAAARAAFATLHLELSLAAQDGTDADALLARLDTHFALITRGYRATPPDEAHPAAATEPTHPSPTEGAP